MPGGMFMCVLFVQAKGERQRLGDALAKTYGLHRLTFKPGLCLAGYNCPRRTRFPGKS